MSSGNSKILVLLMVTVFCSFQHSQCQSHEQHELNKTFLCHPDQSLALLHFKANFVTNPSASSCFPSYPKTETWKEGTDCCSSWDGVKCHAVTSHVTGIDLSCSQLQLQGTIDSNISSIFFSLPSLQKLNLDFNDFYGSNIPSQFGVKFASTLTHLYLSASNFSGNVPSEISHLSNLVVLDLSWNFLRVESDSVLRSIAQNLTHMRVLNLDQIDMSSVLEPASCLMNLSSTLIALSLSECGLQGEFPYNFLHLPSLQELYLSNNLYLTGSLPKSWSNWTNLRFLDISNCNFSGQVSSSIGYLNQLVYLDMDYNMLSGQIPNDILNLTQLEILRLSENRLEGPLPSSPSHLRARQEVFPHLEELYLSSNLLNGTIPSWLFALPSLTQIYLQNNNFTGSLDEFVSQSLRIVDLGNNKLHGPILKSISKSLSFHELYLSQNFLTGSIDQLPWKNIRVIDLHSNFLEGPLPVLPLSTTYFSVSNNSFTGEISSLICDAPILRILDLSSNNFSGLIPSCLGNIGDLLVLNLRKNNFHGTIPDTFAKGSSLSNLNLNGNRLRGVLPRSLLNCECLEVLDLDDNLIVDVFPKWLGTLQQLQVLVLRSNKFHGSIDIGVKVNDSFPMLRILDLSNNNFEGALPARLIKNLKGMVNITENEGKGGPRYMESLTNETSYSFSLEVAMKGIATEMVKILTIFTSIDFSNNMFEGKIPKEIGNLSSLKGLNLSNNCLTGSIPTSIGKLISLEWLDLSSNKLVGQIPTQMVDLIFLAVLNLSHNYLRGLIPQGKQFNTFQVGSYEGNSDLCGFPLPKTCGGDKSNPPTQSVFVNKDSTIVFNWQSSYIGYGCGMIVGITMGYFVFSTRSPEWFVNIVEGKRHKKVQRSKRNTKVRAPKRS